MTNDGALAYEMNDASLTPVVHALQANNACSHAVQLRRRLSLLVQEVVGYLVGVLHMDCTVVQALEYVQWEQGIHAGNQSV